MANPLSNPARRAGGGCLLLFGMVFVLAGLAVGYFAYFPAVLGWWEARSWQEVPCWIEQVGMRESHDSDDGSTTYAVEARYRYVFAGRTYHGDRVSLVGGSDNLGDFHQRVHDELRGYEGKEKPFRCLVNPQKPEESLLYAELRWGLLLLLALFPLLFPLVGGLVGIGGMVSARNAARVAELRARHPEEPWKWKGEWAGEGIRPAADGVAAPMLAALWLLVVLGPLAAAAVMSGAIEQTWVAWLPLLALASLWPLLQAIRRRWRMRAVTGEVQFLPDSLPFHPGQVLSGRLRFSRLLPPRCALELRIRCVQEQVKSSGENTTTSKETVWEHTEMLATDEREIEPGGRCSLPVKVSLPEGVPGTDPMYLAGEGGALRRGHVWTMEIHAGKSMKEIVLPLPVLADGHAPQEVVPAARTPAVGESGTEQLEARLQARGITARFTAEGLPEVLVCPPGRHRAVAVGLLIFGSIWMAVLAVLIVQDAPLLFKLVWGVSAPLIELYAVWLLLHQSKVEFGPDSLRISTQVGPFWGRVVTLRADEIVQFAPQESMRSGQTTYYKVRVETTIRQWHTLADGITEQTTASELARRLQQWKSAQIR